MIGLNGALVATLCAAYFALLVSALWDDQTAGHGDRGSNVRMVAANVLTTRAEVARVRRVDQTIDGVVLGLRRRERSSRCARRPGARRLRGRAQACAMRTMFPDGSRNAQSRAPHG
jgi:hypothetical protein